MNLNFSGSSNITLAFILTFLITSVSFPSFSQTRERSEIEDRYKWDLSEIYLSSDEWRADKEVLQKRADILVSYKGRLSESAENLYEGLQASVELSKVMRKLYLYPRFLSDLDQRNQEYTAMWNEFLSVYAGLTEVMAFMDPEILSAGKEKIEKYIKEEPRLSEFDFYLIDLFRQNEHVLSEKEERLMGFLSISNSKTDDLHGTLLYSDIRYPEATMIGGEKAVIDRSTLYSYLESENRDDRKLAMETYWEELNHYRNTFGQMLVHKLSGENMIRQARNYESMLEMSLEGNNIPEEIYHSLIRNTNKHMDAHYRYWGLKKRMLDLDTLYMFDLVAPVVKDVDLEFSYEEAQEVILEALKPMGDEYRETVKHAFGNRWIDVYPSKGKRVGAYSQGALAHDLHPFILMDYLGFYSDVSTLAHELGHTMHDYYAANNQSIFESDYSLFIAEVPSTINSILLINSMLSKDLDESTRLALLMNYLNEFIASIFRQTMYAEFELRINEKIEKGEALTAEVISQLFGEMSRKYYGHDEGIINVEEKYFSKWSVIGHFYAYSYYVYVYSTSFLASITLADQILTGEEGAIDRFMEMISAGGSDYPVNLLKDAGVDLTTSEPFEYAMKSMHRLMDEVEKILDSRD